MMVASEDRTDNGVILIIVYYIINEAGVYTANFFPENPTR
jgi:hypothetical protein